jgi:hypothetical protein
MLGSTRVKSLSLTGTQWNGTHFNVGDTDWLAQPTSGDRCPDWASLENAINARLAAVNSEECVFMTMNNPEVPAFGFQGNVWSFRHKEPIDSPWNVEVSYRWTQLLSWLRCRFPRIASGGYSTHPQGLGDIYYKFCERDSNGYPLHCNDQPHEWLPSPDYNDANGAIQGVNGEAYQAIHRYWTIQRFLRYSQMSMSQSCFAVIPFLVGSIGQTVEGDQLLSKEFLSCRIRSTMAQYRQYFPNQLIIPMLFLPYEEDRSPASGSSAASGTYTVTNTGTTVNITSAGAGPAAVAFAKNCIDSGRIAQFFITSPTAPTSKVFFADSYTGNTFSGVSPPGAPITSHPISALTVLCIGYATANELSDCMDVVHEAGADGVIVWDWVVASPSNDDTIPTALKQVILDKSREQACKMPEKCGCLY